VVAAIRDPNPLVSGKGFAELRQAGIEVVTGVGVAEAERQNRVFLTAMRERRPHVILKAGMTLDGKIADLHGASRWITGAPARERAHQLRSEADAIVVGIGTVLRDDPELTVRLGRPWPREPLRVVLDTRARTPRTARVIRAGTPSRALIVVGGDAPEDNLKVYWGPRDNKPRFPIQQPASERESGGLRRWLAHSRLRGRSGCNGRRLHSDARHSSRRLHGVDAFGE